MLRPVFVLTSLMVCLSSAIVLAEPMIWQGGQTIAQNVPQRRLAKPNMVQELNLTSDQVQRMQAIRSQYQGQIQQRRQALRQAQQELKSLMASTAPRGQVEEKFRQVESLRQQLAQVQFSSMLDTREILNADQRAKFAEVMQGRRQSMQQGRRGR